MNGWLQIFTIILSNAWIIYLFRKESKEDQQRFNDGWYHFAETTRQENMIFHERLLEIERSKKSR